MGDTNFRGPVFAMGSLEIQSGTSATIEPLDGPSGAYQGIIFLDPHSVPFSKDGLLPGRVPGWFNNPNFVTVDAVPQASSATILAASQAVTASVAMALATVAVTNYSAGAASIAVGVPIVPSGTTSVVNVIALDFGFTTGTTIANSSVVAVPDVSLFTAGMWVTLGNVANAAGTASLFTQVQALGTNLVIGSGTVYVSPMPATALGIPIGGANLFGAGLLPPATQFGPTTVTPVDVSKDLQAGLARVHNNREYLARNVSVTGTTGATAAVLVTGYDVFNRLMTELITSSGTTTIFGKKGFKYLQSVVPQQTQASGTTFTLGIGDTFSFPMRADEAQQLQIWAGNTAVTNNVGFTQATTAVASNTTGDVRGTIQLSGNGAGTPISNAATTNNVLRLTITQNPGVAALVNTTPLNLVPLFGVAQSTT